MHGHSGRIFLSWIERGRHGNSRHLRIRAGSVSGLHYIDGQAVREAEGTREIRDVFVALTDLPIKDGDFGALLPLALLEVPVKEHAKTKGGALR